MKFKNQALIILLSGSIGLCSLTAQLALPASGSDASGPGGSVSYTIGQVAYSTVDGQNGTENQGVQQPYEIFTVAVEEVASFECIVYPNPTDGLIILEVVNYPIQALHYQLSDLQGRLLLANDLQGAETSIFMENLPAATYFLTVLQHDKKVKSYKIIKN